MSREKQIEEMAEEISDVWNNKCQFTTCKGCKYFDFNDNECQEKLIADHLITKGYRKQSEWISVEDRLPKVDTDVLVITANGSFKVARCNIYHNGTLVLWMTNDGLGEKAITHWMPLPEAPKMKGGAE